jgi:hypothetical protein
MDDTKKLSSNKASGLLTSGGAAKQSLAAAYSQRLRMAEAIEAVTKMLNAYPNARDGIRDGYMGVIAALLCKYPRQVALRCADPINGVTRQSKFLPTVADCVQWLEREQLPFERAHEREGRVAQQLADRRRYEEGDHVGPEADVEYRKQVAVRMKDELRAKGFQFKGDQTKPAREPWKRFSVDELRKIYGPRSEGK